MTPRIAFLLLVFVVLGDIATSIGFNLNWSFWNFGLIIKTPIEFYLLFCSLKFWRSNLLIYIIISLFIIWLIGTTACSIYNPNILSNAAINRIFLPEDTNIYTASFKVFSRYIFFFTLSVLLYLYADNLDFTRNAKKLFEYFIIINSLCIILGSIFSIQLFSAYNPGGTITEYEVRFGYKGILYGINEISGIYFLAISHFYREVFLFKNRKKYIFLIIVILSSFLTGAKGAMIAVILLTTYYLFRYKRKFFMWFYLPVVVALILIITVVYSDLITVFLNSFTKSDSILTILMSGRNDYITSNLSYIATNWSPINYLLGDGSLYTETDFLDLYFFFGLGLILYLYFYTKLFIKFERTPDNVFIYILMLLLAFTNGHMIQSAVFPVFLFLYLISSINTFSPNNNNENSICFNGDR